MILRWNKQYPDKRRCIMYKRILVPLDGSRFSSYTLIPAYEIADRFNSEIIFLRVIEPARSIAVSGGNFILSESPHSAALTMDIALEEESRQVKRAKSYLKRKTKTGRCNSTKCKYRVRVGYPGEEIITVAKNEKVDLIIMSSHSRGGIKRAILGSVTDKVIRKSKNSVLVIHPKSS